MMGMAWSWVHSRMVLVVIFLESLDFVYFAVTISDPVHEVEAIHCRQLLIGHLKFLH